MITASSLQVPGGWRAVRVQADNDPVYPAQQMNMSADYATLLDPTTGLTKTVFEGLSLPCFIHGHGVHGRDQAAPFVARDVVHFYFIDGDGPGTATICSKRKPSAGGPVLPEGYTRFCHAYVLPMAGSATLLPSLPQGGSTQFQVRGNKVRYPNNPDIIGTGSYPWMTINLSEWIPVEEALLTTFYLDGEMKGKPLGLMGMIASTALGNFCNLSLYPTVATIPYAQDGFCEAVLNKCGQSFLATFDAAAGEVDGFTLDVFVVGYEF